MSPSEKEPSWKCRGPESQPSVADAPRDRREDEISLAGRSQMVMDSQARLKCLNCTILPLGDHWRAFSGEYGVEIVGNE